VVKSQELRSGGCNRGHHDVGSEMGSQDGEDVLRDGDVLTAGVCVWPDDVGYLGDDQSRELQHSE
jgi:hypothetical protein